MATWFSKFFGFDRDGVDNAPEKNNGFSRAIGQFFSDLSGRSQDYENTLARDEQARQFQTSEREAEQAYQTSEREAQNSWNLEQWNRENEYNSPMMQLQRLKEAGLNPNMMYGGSGDIAQASSLQGSAGSAPAAPGASMSSPLGFVGQAVDSTVSNLLSLEELKGKKIENETLYEFNRASIDKMKADTKKAVSEGHLTDLQATQLDSCMDAFIRKSSADADVAEQEYNRLIAETDLIIKQSAKTEAETANIEADTDLMGNRKENLNADTKLKNAESLRPLWEAYFRDNIGVDPNAKDINMLIQALLSGDQTGTKVMTHLFNNLRQTAESFSQTSVGKVLKAVPNANTMGSKLLNWLFGR